MSNIQNITKERNKYQNFFNKLNKNSPLRDELKKVINALESWLNYLKTKKVTPNLEKQRKILVNEGILRNSTFNWFTSYVSNEKKFRTNSKKEENKLKEFLFKNSNSQNEEEKKLKEFLFNSNYSKSPRTPLSNRFSNF